MLVTELPFMQLTHYWNVFITSRATRGWNKKGITVRTECGGEGEFANLVALLKYYENSIAMSGIDQAIKDCATSGKVR